MTTNFVSSSAVISRDGLYRYILIRRWESGGTAIFIGLNPSTADATKDDPTIRRCKSLARSWGCGGLVMLNLFAARCTDPKKLKSFANPVGPDHDTHIRIAIEEITGPIVAAWGQHPGCIDRAKDALKLIRRSRPETPIQVLGLTKDGYPRHPLYIKADTVLVDWNLTNSPYCL